jgi:hypothetical protein
MEHGPGGWPHGSNTPSANKAGSVERFWSHIASKSIQPPLRGQKPRIPAAEVPC